MDFAVDRYDDGYVVTLFPPLVVAEEEHRGLTPAATHDLLAQHRQERRDVGEQMFAASAYFERGATDRRRAIRVACRRAGAGDATNDDISVIRQELAVHPREFYLVDALYRAGCQVDALDMMLTVLEHGSQWDHMQSALGFIAEWSPATFERVSLPIIRGTFFEGLTLTTSEEANQTRVWVMIYAGVQLGKTAGGFASGTVGTGRYR